MLDILLTQLETKEEKAICQVNESNTIGLLCFKRSQVCFVSYS